MRAYEIIKKKRDGLELSEAELSFLISRYISGEIPDYQISAFLMADFFRGMSEKETIALTKIMRNSGDVLDLSDIDGPKIDKHSTGGVGDKTSIILSPLLAAAGLIVPMVCGRGLGHTGGTLDKLEAVPGFRTDLSIAEFRLNLRNIGAAIMGQTKELDPADRKLYALRDATATVESIPLIASSIMSKKLAEGIDGLVLDIKTGSGAFMKSIAEARTLAKTMVNLGNSFGVRTIAILTDMEQPLGNAVGNSLEIKECVNALQGSWPADLKELTLTLGAWMIKTAAMVSGFSFKIDGKDINCKEGPEDCKRGLMDLIQDGSAFRKFVAIVEAQHGNSAALSIQGLLPSAKAVKRITSGREGFIQRIDAEKAGISSMLLGAGRQKMDDPIDPSAGIILSKKSGDAIKYGEQIAVFHYTSDAGLKEAETIFLSGIEIGAEKPQKRDIVFEVIS